MVVAVGTISSAAVLLNQSLAAAYTGGSASSVMLYAAGEMRQDLLDAVTKMRGVDAAQGRRAFVAYLDPVVGSASAVTSGARDIQLTALPDYGDQRIDRILPRTGTVPPARGEIVFERSVLRVLDLSISQLVVVRTSGGHAQTLQIAGLAYEPDATLAAQAAVQALADRVRNRAEAAGTPIM